MSQLKIVKIGVRKGSRRTVFLFRRKTSVTFSIKELLISNRMIFELAESICSASQKLMYFMIKARVDIMNLDGIQFTTLLNNLKCAYNNHKECVLFYEIRFVRNRSAVAHSYFALLICGHDTLEILLKISTLFGFRFESLFTLHIFLISPHSFCIFVEILRLWQFVMFLYCWIIIHRQSLCLSSIRFIAKQYTE